MLLLLDVEDGVVVGDEVVVWDEEVVEDEEVVTTSGWPVTTPAALVSVTKLVKMLLKGLLTEGSAGAAVVTARSRT